MNEIKIIQNLIKYYFNLWIQFVTGSNGLIGSAIKDYSEKDNLYNYIFKNKNEPDISDINKLLNFFKNNRINYVINCAAYTNISDSELQKELMMNTNFMELKIF